MVQGFRVSHASFCCRNAFILSGFTELFNSGFWVLGADYLNRASDCVADAALSVCSF